VERPKKENVNEEKEPIGEGVIKEPSGDELSGDDKSLDKEILDTTVDDSYESYEEDEDEEEGSAEARVESATLKPQEVTEAPTKLEDKGGNQEHEANHSKDQERVIQPEIRKEGITLTDTLPDSRKESPREKPKPEIKKEEGSAPKEGKEQEQPKTGEEKQKGELKQELKQEGEITLLQKKETI